MPGGLGLMGTPTPDNEPASGCALCFGSGQPLGLVQPKYVTLNFLNVRPGAAFGPTNFIPVGDYRLQHVTGCAYSLVVSGVFGMSLLWGVATTRVIVAQLGSPQSVWASLPGFTCQDYLGEDAVSFPTDVIYGGVIRIRWSMDGL